MPVRCTPVPPEAVRLRDPFLAPRQRIVLEAALPANRRWCEATGRFAQYDLGWKEGMPGRPHVYWDSDVAKYVEAESLGLQLRPDPARRADLDALVERICRAQQPDGYLNPHFTVVAPQRRFRNVNDHELYCAGHLIEAAIAHHRATGSPRLLDAMRRYGALIERDFGPGGWREGGYCGHQELELALVALWRHTGERRWLDLARRQIDARGTQPHWFDRCRADMGDGHYVFKPPFPPDHSYFQAHAPVREQRRVTGHAVRAMYQYCAMADLAAEDGDAALADACRALWAHASGPMRYVTGGLGSSKINEGFTRDHHLPNHEAYCETCASVGYILWARRMLALDGDAAYGDLLETTLLNAACAGMSLDGGRFFYGNPLASDGDILRQEWFDCSCCPPNLCRLLLGAGSLVAGTSSAALWLHLPAAGRIAATVDGEPFIIEVDSQWPWDGRVAITVVAAPRHPVAVRLRLPCWSPTWRLTVGGAAAEPALERGYAVVTRAWSAGDRVALDLEMPVRRLHADPRIAADCGRVALARGPVVFCAEGADNGDDLDALVLPDDALLAFRRREDGLAAELTGRAWRERPFPDGPYRTEPPARDPVPFTAIPYAAWNNRGAGAMRVWLRRAAAGG